MNRKYYAFAIVFVAMMLSTLFFIKRDNLLLPRVEGSPTPTAVSLPASDKSVLPSPAPSQSQLSLNVPVDQFFQRITQKTFGQYITPQNSPVQPEKFTGYHTGVDVEYEDASGEVEVRSIYEGRVVFSGYVDGYGGVAIISHSINSTDYLSLYGHLNPASLTQKDEQVAKSQKIGVLGQGYTNETDGERRHLHFAIIKGNDIDFRGYVQNENELDGWVNPVDFINNNGEV